MKVHQYESYEQYVANQTEANKRKIKNVWAHQTTMAAIVRYYQRQYKVYPKKVLCHGVRNGAEQHFFERHIPHNIEVLGTEISETATQFPKTIQWDFQKQKDEWIGYWDVVYSNSFDHTPNPVETLCTWRDQLNHSGILVVDHSVWIGRSNQKPDHVDCLDISFEELEEMIESNEMNIMTKKQFISNDDHMKKICKSWFYIIRKEL